MNANVLPSPPDDTSLWYRLNYTPLGDALRRRWTKSLDYRRVVKSANLPPPLDTLVRKVVEKAGLWRREQVEVARELVAHFRDALDRGVCPEGAITAFGDPVVAAKLICRAKKRRRPLLYRTCERIAHISAITTAIFLIIYTVLAIRFHAGNPTITRNYVAELNAHTSLIPEGDRAWPFYREAYLLKKRWPLKWVDEPRSALRPGGKHWLEVVARCEADQNSVMLFREGAKKPRLGSLLSDGGEKELADAYRYPFGKKAAENTPSANPKLTDILLPQAEVIADGYGLLRTDALVALDGGDALRCMADLESIYGMIDHLFELRFPFTAGYGFPFLMQADELLGAVLRDRPELFSNEQWISLSHKRSSFDAARVVRAYIDFRKLMFEDLIQRVYTDDGQGSGRLTQPDMALGYFMADPTFYALADDIDRSVPLVQKLLFPIFSLCIADRRDIVAEFDALMGLNLQEQGMPLWMRDQCKADQASLEWQKDLRWLRFLPLDSFYSSMSMALTGSELATQQRDATLVAIALELYRRKSGEYPASLQALTPRFLPDVPLDHFDGKFIKYKFVDGRPLLYSVGTDRIDDGGVLPKSTDRCLANYRANYWVPASKIAEALKSKTIRRGDWVLWPPVDY